MLESAKPRQERGYSQELGHRSLTQIDQEACAKNLRTSKLGNEELFLDFVPNITHTVKVCKPKQPLSSVESLAAPAISTKAGLELLKPVDLQLNLTGNAPCTVIFDTGASLAITGDKQDFLPNTFKEVTSLKLGGMAAGAPITGEGNVSWTFPCNNGDQMAIITKCYLVPTATTRLLSPQQIFDKQNGNGGKFWGDEDQFHLEYQNKPVISIDYSPSSNLPVGYALTTSSDPSTQVNLTLLDEENQNLTA